MTLTYKDKKTVTVRLSKPEGDLVYGQVSGNPAVSLSRSPISTL